EGRSCFPDRHGELTVQLVDAMRSAFGEDGLARVITARTDEQLRSYRELLASAGPGLRGRVDALAAQRTAEGYMADVVEEGVVGEGGSYVLVEHHCPICDAARSCLGFCAAELRLFRDALGDDATVERTEHLLGDGVRCSYRISPR
ncbi:MAG: helix-turn-helix transcriptional regulator, partial [Acidimicrobiia bacterium]